MADIYWPLLILGLALMAWGLHKLGKRLGDMSHKRWLKPSEPGSLPEEAVRFMQTSMQCCFCNAPLLAGPSGGMSQNFFCAEPDCNSRFNFVPSQPTDHLHIPWGEFTGECPPSYIQERHFMRLKAYLDERGIKNIELIQRL